MDAIQLITTGRPLEKREVPLPAVGDSDVLVRIRATGVCHSDAHYRAGVSDLGTLPLTLGHEIAGEVEAVGKYVTAVTVGQRVCLHYLIVCGTCDHCIAGREQYCVHGAMLGHHVDGGLATHIVVPERNAVPLPDSISYEHGAVMMCSSATSLHALRKSRFVAGETVAVYGTGGLGMSAIQIAHAIGALEVFAVDIDPGKLKLAETFGAVPVDASASDPVEEIMRLTDGRGVHVSLEFAGLAKTTKQAVRSLAIQGRCVIVGINTAPVDIDTYRDMIGRECEMIGANDHTLPEISLLIELAKHGKLDLSDVVSNTIPLEAEAVNATLSSLEAYSSAVRTVVVQ